MYDALPDIRDFYRSQIKDLTRQIDATQRRDPVLHRLHAERNVVRNKLQTLNDDTHALPQGAMALYGAW